MGQGSFIELWHRQLETQHAERDTIMLNAQALSRPALYSPVPTISALGRR